MKLLKAMQFLKDGKGAGAAEFALVVPIFFTLVYGILNISIVAFADAALHRAVEAAARCASVGVSCTDSADTAAYASSHYQGPQVSQSFTYTNPTTGSCSGMKEVYGTGSYHINLIVVSVPVNLHARSCYP